MPFGAEPLDLTEEERRELQQMTQSRTLPAGDVMRSRMILLLSDGVAYQKIQDLLDTTAPTIARWKRRFLQHRVAGLMEELHPGQQPSVRTPKLQAKVLAHSRKTYSINQVLNPIRQGAVSMTIQALGSNSAIVAERPMYFIFNIGGVPGTETGGSDVIGYTGS